MIELVAADGKSWKLAITNLEVSLANYKELVVDGKIQLAYPSNIVENLITWLLKFGTGSTLSCNAQKNKDVKQQFFLSLSREELLVTLEAAELVGLVSLLDCGAQYVSDLLSNMTDDEMKKYLDIESDPLTPEAATTVQTLLTYITPNPPAVP